MIILFQLNRNVLKYHRHPLNLAALRRPVGRTPAVAQLLPLFYFENKSRLHITN